MSDLTRVLRETGHPACPQVICKITKAAGYRWRKARIVLTSSDQNYTEKLDRIRSILSGLRSDEAFFSIDEFGPFAVKMKPGRMLSAPGEQRVVPQWQKSKGCMIMTAALELSGNQVTHFYSPRKNTAEMIRMMELLVQKDRDRRKLYLSWDAASWHISKSLYKRVEEHNAGVVSGNGPTVATAPLPAGAQFLNVIESVFSGMARSIIHNSDYKTLGPCQGSNRSVLRRAECALHAASQAGREEDLGEGAGGVRILPREQLQGPTLPLKAPICVRIATPVAGSAVAQIDRRRRHPPDLAHLGSGYLQQPRRLRTPRPSSNARRMRCTLNGVVLGLPRRLPDDRARSSPAITRSRIIARSNSLNTPSIPNSILPDGVLVSRACWCR